MTVLTVIYEWPAELDIFEQAVFAYLFLAHFLKCITLCIFRKLIKVHEDLVSFSF